MWHSIYPTLFFSWGVFRYVEDVVANRRTVSSSSTCWIIYYYYLIPLFVLYSRNSTELISSCTNASVPELTILECKLSCNCVYRKYLQSSQFPLPGPSLCSIALCVWVCILMLEVASYCAHDSRAIGAKDT